MNSSESKSSLSLPFSTSNFNVFQVNFNCGGAISSHIEAKNKNDGFSATSLSSIENF